MAIASCWQQAALADSKLAGPIMSSSERWCSGLYVDRVLINWVDRIQLE